MDPSKSKEATAVQAISAAPQVQGINYPTLQELRKGHDHTTLQEAILKAQARKALQNTNWGAKLPWHGENGTSASKRRAMVTSTGRVYTLRQDPEQLDAGFTRSRAE